MSGYEKVSLNIIDHFTTPPMQFKEYFDLLKKNKAEYTAIYESVKDKKLYGIGLPVEKTATINAHGYKADFPSWTNYGLLLMRLGLPICYRDTNVNVLSGDSIRKYTDAELLRLLSKELLLDHTAVRALTDRGFGKYLGVSYGQEINKPCYEQLTHERHHGEYTGNYLPVKVCNAHTRTPKRLQILWTWILTLFLLRPFNIKTSLAVRLYRLHRKSITIIGCKKAA